MARRFRPLRPANVTLALWAWKYRAELLSWAEFGLRATAAAARRDGLDDARAEAALRLRLMWTSGRAPVDVRVSDGVARVEGRVTPEVRAAVQDAVAATGGIEHLDDRTTLAAPARRAFLR